MRKQLTLSGRKLDPEKKEPDSSQMGFWGILAGRPQGSVYAGTVGKTKVMKQRAKSKRAKQSRKVNRGK